MNIKLKKIMCIAFVLFANINHCTSEQEQGVKFRFELYSLGDDSLGVTELSSTQIQDIIRSGKATVHEPTLYGDDYEGGRTDDYGTQEFEDMRCELEPILSQLTHESGGVLRLNPFILDRILPSDHKSPGIAHIGIVDEQSGMFRVQVVSKNIIEDENSDSLPVFALFCEYALDSKKARQYANSGSIGLDDHSCLLNPIELAYELGFLRKTYKDYVDSGNIYKKVISRERAGDMATYFGHAKSMIDFYDGALLPGLTTAYEWMSFIGLDLYKSDRMSDLLVDCHCIEIYAPDQDGYQILSDYKTKTK